MKCVGYKNLSLNFASVPPHASYAREPQPYDCTINLTLPLPIMIIANTSPVPEVCVPFRITDRIRAKSGIQCNYTIGLRDSCRVEPIKEDRKHFASI